MSSLDDIFGPDPVSELMDKAGLTRAKLVKELAGKIKATETKFFQHRGKVVSKRTMKALHIQIQALDMALKLRRMYPDPKLDVNHSGNISLLTLLEEIDGSTRGLPGSKTDPKRSVSTDE